MMSGSIPTGGRTSSSDFGRACCRSDAEFHWEDETLGPRLVPKESRQDNPKQMAASSQTPGLLGIKGAHHLPFCHPSVVSSYAITLATY